MPENFLGIFKNDTQNSLRYLNEEHSNLRNLIENHEIFDNTYFQLDAQVDGFMQLLEDQRNEMTIFHYSGHQGDDAIWIGDTAFNNEGLIKILNTATNLKMVFINGCSSDAIIDALDNVPIVIGTTTPVYDHFAKTLSTRFYKLLLNENENINHSDLIESVFEQSRGFQQGFYMDPDSNEEVHRGPMAMDELTKKLDNYIIRINENAENFEQRVTYNFEPEQYPVHSGFMELEHEIQEEEGLDEEVYKYYPYFLCIHLYKLSNFDYDIEYQKLGETRYRTTQRIFNEFLKLLKYSAYSIIWSISKAHPEFMASLSSEVKELLQENLTISSRPGKNHNKTTQNLAIIYANIPDEFIKGKPLYQKLKKCILENEKDFKEVSDFFLIHTDQNNRSYHQYIKAETYLRIFLKRHKFLRSLGIESIYGVSYHRFKYDTEPSYRINRSYYSVLSRPRALLHEKNGILPATDDINIHSIYIYTNNNEEDEQCRALNLSPFYLDINSADKAKNKMKLYYLDVFYIKNNTRRLIYEPIDAEYTNGDSDNKPITVDFTNEFLNDKLAKEIQSTKKLREHFDAIWELIS